MSYTTNLKNKENLIVKFYNKITNKEAKSLKDIPYKTIRWLSCIPSSSLAIPLLVDELDGGKTLNEAAIKTGLTKDKVRTVKDKLK